MDQVKNLWTKGVLSIKLGKAIQEELGASYPSKLTSECLYFCIKGLG
jgi:hypothetical protein